MYMYELVRSIVLLVGYKSDTMIRTNLHQSSTTIGLLNSLRLTALSDTDVHAMCTVTTPPRPV
jgi:hypothetical protein